MDLRNTEVDGTPSGRPLDVWLLQDGEPLPIDEDARLMRTGDQARRLVASGYRVTWWASRFNHVRKEFRQASRHGSGVWREMEDGYRIALLDGPGYTSNLSWQRIRHQRHVAAHFARVAGELSPPALIVGSYPSPELCEAGSAYAARHAVPFVLDIRDPWPDMFAGYLPQGVRWGLQPLVWHYRRKIERVARAADAVVAVSDAMLTWGVRQAGRPRRQTDRVFHIGFKRGTEDRVIQVPERFSADCPLVCVFASTCGRSYNGETLIEAARLLDAAGERRVSFVIVGDGEMRERWGTRAQGVSNVHFTGWVEHADLLKHFHRAHLGAILMKGGVTPFWLGNKIFEYLAASLGLLNDVPAEAAHIVSSRHVGVNVPAGDASALAAAVSGLVDEPTRVRAYMENAQRVFAREFDREHIQAEYVAFLEDVLARGHSMPLIVRTA